MIKNKVNPIERGMLGFRGYPSSPSAISLCHRLSIYPLPFILHYFLPLLKVQNDMLGYINCRLWIAISISFIPHLCTYWFVLLYSTQQRRAQCTWDNCPNSCLLAILMFQPIPYPFIYIYIGVRLDKVGPLGIPIHEYADIQIDSIISKSIAGSDGMLHLGML